MDDCDLFVLLPLLDLPDFKLVPCRESLEFSVNHNHQTLPKRQQECVNITFDLYYTYITFDFPDEVLDLTTPALPLVNIAEEELFPDFSVLGSFNFSAPSASLILKRGHV